ncbi:MAG TPA: hypothetical protein VH599_14750 [Ktedonobacterales bacterium]|jgi:hypothetical protein
MNNLLLGLDTLPQDVLKEDGLEEYERNQAFFFRVLAELNVNIFIAERIICFPYEELFSEGPFYHIFLGQVIDNALEMSILLITKLATDDGKDVHTLTGFKNQLFNLTRPEYQQAICERLAAVRFDAQTQVLLRKAKEIRDQSLAHYLDDFFEASFNPTKKLVRLTLPEIQKLRDVLNSLLHTLTINTDQQWLPNEYVNGKPDIAAILELLISTSYLLRMPQDDPKRWEYRRPKLSADQMTLLNSYRRQFGLKEG